MPKFSMTLKKYKFLNKENQDAYRSATIQSVDFYLNNGWSLPSSVSRAADDLKITQDLVRHIYGRIDRKKYPKRNGSIATYKRHSAI